MQNLINTVSQLKEFVFVSVGIALFFLIIFSFQIKKLNLRSKSIRWLGLFFQIDKLSQARFIIYYLMLTFIMSCCIRFQEYNLVHVTTFIILFVAYIIVDVKNKTFLFGLVNNIMAGVSLVLLNMIMRYLNLISANFTFIVIYIAASIFICIYYIYVFLYEMQSLSKGK